MNRRRAVVIALAAISLPLTGHPFGRRAVADEAESLTVAQVHARLRAMPGHANFAHAKLFALELDGVDLHGANFNDANLSETNMRGANLTGATFVGAYLSATKFDNSDLRHARFTGATFLTTAAAANFSDADLSHSSGYLIAPSGIFTHANLAGAKLRPDMSNQPMGLLHSIFSEADLGHANLSGADLGLANLSSAKLARALVRGTSFDQADLSRADFRGADVTDAIFSQADIAQTDFRRVVGRGSMRGLATARNRSEAKFG